MGSRIRSFFAPNRVVVYLTALAALAGAVAAVWGDLDWTTTVGVIASLGTLLGVVVKWLDGWQKYEASERGDTNGGIPPLPKPDEQ
jgi:hypothetical protein